MLIRAPWPTSAGRDAAAVAGTDALVRLVTAVRQVRSEQEIDPGAAVSVTVRARNHADVLHASRAVIERLVRCEALAFADADTALPGGSAVAVDPDFDAAVQLGEADRAAMRDRLAKQLEKARAQLEGANKKLANENFVSRAKPEAVERVRADAETLRATIAAIEERLGAL